MVSPLPVVLPPPYARLMQRLVLLLTAAVAAVGGGAEARTLPLTATRRVVAVTRSGPVAGAEDALGMRWHGVPYAQPPVGELRFRAPHQRTPWTQVLDCTRRDRRICPQLASLFGKLVIGSEDCLYLNVFAPAAPSRELRPVMVFLHGGAYVAGDDSEAELYDGARLASNASVVVVTLDYRLGVLGFLAHPALRASGDSSNLGLLDQRAALRWVRDNIVAFGGDPDRVTLFGQSAGAMAVCAHVASPASEGLFRAALLESGNCDSPLLWAPLDAALQQGRAFAALRGCPDDDHAAACLQSLPLAALMAHDLAPSSAPLAPLIVWVPVVDGLPDGVLELPLAALRRSRRVPVIVGTVRDEGTMFAAVASTMFGKALTPITDAELGELLLRVYNASTADAVLRRYADGSPTARLALILRDSLFACPARRTAAALAASGGRAWQYLFDYDLRWDVSRLGLGTYHASELSFVFRNRGKHIFDAADERVEAAFSRLWGAFAHDADPSAGAPPAWPAYDTADEAVLRVNDASSVATHLLRANCSFWDAVQATAAALPVAVF